MPRRFKSEVVYTSHIISVDAPHEKEEVIFLVLEPSDKHWNKWMEEFPVQYWALNLYTGEKFEFHRNSIIAENAKELLT